MQQYHTNIYQIKANKYKNLYYDLNIYIEFRGWNYRFIPKFWNHKLFALLYAKFLLCLPFLFTRHFQTKSAIQTFVYALLEYCQDFIQSMNSLRYLHCIALTNRITFWSAWKCFDYPIASNSATTAQKHWLGVWVHIRLTCMRWIL
jgi:hypothetical protein